MIKKLQNFRKNASLVLCSMLLTTSMGALGQEMALAENPYLVTDQQEKENAKPLSKVLKELEERFNVYLNYEVEMVNEKFVDSNEKVSDFKSLDEALTKFLTPINLKFERLQDNYYVIYRAKDNSTHNIGKTINRSTMSVDDNEIVVAILEDARRLPATMVFSQNILVTGRVISSEENESLPGVSVLERGTTNGTITDVDGVYRLNVREGATLVFSFVGYTPLEIEVGNRTVVDAQLIPDIRQLDEIVVVGYGVQRRSDITGSVASVAQERLEMVPNLNIAQVIQGAIPGVMIQTTTAGAASSEAILVRGRNSIQASNDPLIVVDGIPYGGELRDINPNDVRSIEILKDASAAAIYGSRGANGVILITSKEGRRGRPVIDYDGKFSLPKLCHDP
jgi:TonB-dependent SusC/RagA subfamily outer membrane receptor